MHALRTFTDLPGNGGSLVRLDQPVASLFPFDRVRPGQAAFLADARRAFEEGKHLVAHAPTGLGKTAVALAAGLEHVIREDKVALFLTSKQSQHRIAIETAQRIAARAGTLRIVDVIGKHAMCLQPDAPRGRGAFHAYCEMKVTSRSCTFYAASSEGAVEEVSERALHVQDLIEVCGRHRVCPHKVALEAAKGADIIVCDYNYVFSNLQERIFARIGRSLEDAILLVDEAHNLPERIRSQQCTDLSLSEVVRGAREARAVDPTLAAELKAVARNLEDSLRSFHRQGRVVRDFLAEVMDLTAHGGPVLECEELARDCQRTGEVLIRQGNPTVLLNLSTFLSMWNEREEAVLRIAEGGAENRISYRLLDPSILSGSIFHAVHASVVMSGTLHPTAMYADLLGVGEERRMLRAYASPFPAENRRIVVTSQVTTAYGRRDDRMYRAIAQEITRLAAAVPGNIASFFPSYDLIGKVLACIRWSDLSKEVLVERQTWGKAERDHCLRWLQARSETGGLLVGVLGGGLSEGVDYKDNLLRAVCIVGLPLSPPTLEVEALKTYYSGRFGREKAHEYAVVYPALNKVLQAAGRPIRGEQDRAIIVLMDRRYLDSRYASGMPPDFRYTATTDAAREAIAYFSADLRRLGSEESSSAKGVACL